MYLPGPFAVTDPDRLREFMIGHSFATLVSSGENGPVVSHLPLLLDPDRGPHGTLVGHFARANDHWRNTDGQTALAIFHGPHAYISPGWYQEQNVVPTWNYVAVHAAGRLSIKDDRDWLRELVRRTVDVYEASQPLPWRMESQPSEFIDRLLAGIVGFELPIERLEGKWKLSQNHSEARRRNAIAGLQSTGNTASLQIAEWMTATLPPHSTSSSQNPVLPVGQGKCHPHGLTERPYLA